MNEGQVKFTVGTANPFTVNVANGIASTNWQIPFNWTAGTYNIAAKFLGTNNYVPSNNTNTLTIDPPTVTNVDPVNGAVNVPNNKVIKVTFIEPITAGSTYSSITVKNSGGAVKLMNASINGNVLTLTPVYNYLTGYKYSVNIPANAVKDTAGNGLATGYTSSFTITPLILTSTDPVNGAVNVPNNKVIKITFSEPITPGSAYSSITVKNSAGALKQMTTSISGNVLTLTPVYPYLTGYKYTVNIPANAIKDSLGNGLSVEYTSSFTISTT